MVQVSVHPATAERRSAWHALRPVLVLGGLVAVWWALMTGVAHAQDTPGAERHGLADRARSQVQAHQLTHQQAHQKTHPVRHVARRVQHVHVTTPLRVHVERHVRSVTRTATTTVHRTPLASIATETGRASTTLRTTLSTTVTTTRALVRSTTGPVVAPVTAPVLGTVEDGGKGSAVKPQSPTGQGNSHFQQRSPKVAAISLAAFPTAPEQSFASSTTAHPTAEPSPAGAPLDGPRRTPTLPDPCTSLSGSGPSSSTPVGVLESSLLAVPMSIRGLPTWRLARPSGGPAYQPGSSPD